MPIAETMKIEAAVVKPITEPLARIIAPAPIKPIPVITCAAMRPGSARLPGKISRNRKDTIVNNDELNPTITNVLNPAGLRYHSRSKPIIAESIKVTISLMIISRVEMSDIFFWWAWGDSNLRPLHYQCNALTN